MCIGGMWLGGGLCKPCEERSRKLKEALKAKNAAEAVKQVVMGVAEVVGLKAKETD